MINTQPIALVACKECTTRRNTLEQLKNENHELKMQLFTTQEI
jgi:hypothetical protein